MRFPCHPTEDFGQRHFGHAELGDARRTKRLISSANEISIRPYGNLPQKFETPAQLRGLYHLMNCESVTHQAILDSHVQTTLEAIEQSEEETVLILHDSTELDFSERETLEGLGQIGNGSRQGYICFNSLAVTTEGEAIGLTNQILHRRVKAPDKESCAERRNRKSRESRVWLSLTESLPADSSLVDVCDQGADTFEFLEHESRSGRRFVIRSAYNRGIVIGHDEQDEPGNLRTYTRTLSPLDSWTLELPAARKEIRPKRKGQKTKYKRQKRTAELFVSAAPVLIKPPSRTRGEHGQEPLPMWVVRVWEATPPKDEKGLEWFLLTNEPIHGSDDAYRVVGWYEERWVVEELHKAKKTGMRVEHLQFETEAALQPTIALLSVVALTLLSLRDKARKIDTRDDPASSIIEREYVDVLSLWRHGEIKQDWSVHDFYYALGRLGGHQNRSCDSPPGWQVLWHGWLKLHTMVQGTELIGRRKSGKT